MTRIATASLLVVVAAFAQTPAPVTAWIREHAIPLKSAEPVALTSRDNRFDDMKPLKSVVGDARIVALGEATHGTREFFQLKHRMLEFLVTELGFTIFSIEASMPEAYALNDYVLNGKGDPAALLKGMYFWTWNTQEVLTMIRWMREYNLQAEPEHRVQFTGFDMQMPDAAADIVRHFVTANDKAFAGEVAQAAEMAVASTNTSAGRFGVATASFPVAEARGKRLRLNGYIRSQDITHGWAGLWMRVDGKPGAPPLAFDNMQSHPVTGTTDWQAYSIELPVASEATLVAFGALLAGDGRAWFDSLRFEIDGVPWEAPTDRDLDFEGTPPAGFYLGGNSYRVAPDATVAHTGRSSLGMTFAGLPTPNGPDPKDASKRWQSIVSHLEANADTYTNGGAARSAVDWAIQNARVVMQAMNLRAGGNNRDRDMAANVGWILDQNPKAKIVLWAHNGHVRTSAQGEYVTMGQHLRQKYGDSLRVFGFAFNQGSFRAVESGKGVIEHTVSAAPLDTLDAALASAGHPLLALDLKALPENGPVTEWFRQPHGSRSVGAMFSAAWSNAGFDPIIAPNTFDVLLFVDKTTPSSPVQATSKNPVEVTELKEEPGWREVRDNQYGVSLRLPPTWRFDDARRFGERETTLRFRDDGVSHTGSLYYKVYDKSEPALPDAAAMRARIGPKVRQRVQEGLLGYRIDPANCESKTIGGNPALICLGEYKRGDLKMTEYLAWVANRNASALFFGSAPTVDFDDFRPNFEMLAQSLILP